eukprot:tig00001339_g8289.t1
MQIAKDATLQWRARSHTLCQILSPLVAIALLASLELLIRSKVFGSLPVYWPPRPLGAETERTWAEGLECNEYFVVINSDPSPGAAAFLGFSGRDGFDVNASEPRLPAGSAAGLLGRVKQAICRDYRDWERGPSPFDPLHNLILVRPRAPGRPATLTHPHAENFTSARGGAGAGRAVEEAVAAALREYNRRSVEQIKRSALRDAVPDGVVEVEEAGPRRLRFTVQANENALWQNHRRNDLALFDDGTGTRVDPAHARAGAGLRVRASLQAWPREEALAALVGRVLTALEAALAGLTGLLALVRPAPPPRRAADGARRAGEAGRPGGAVVLHAAHATAALFLYAASCLGTARPAAPRRPRARPRGAQVGLAHLAAAFVRRPRAAALGYAAALLFSLIAIALGAVYPTQIVRPAARRPPAPPRAASRGGGRAAAAVGGGAAARGGLAGGGGAVGGVRGGPVRGAGALLDGSVPQLRSSLAALGLQVYTPGVHELRHPPLALQAAAFAALALALDPGPPRRLPARPAPPRPPPPPPPAHPAPDEPARAALLCVPCWPPPPAPRRGGARGGAGAGAPALLAVRDLTVRYEGAGRAALAGVSLEVRGGELLGLVGSNGAGKSTLLEVLTGRLEPSGGAVLLEGRRLRGGGAGGGAIGYCPQGEALWGDLTAGEHVLLFARVGLQGEGHRRARELSGGMRRRLQLAVALAGAPACSSSTSSAPPSTPSTAAPPPPSSPPPATPPAPPPHLPQRRRDEGPPCSRARPAPAAASRAADGGGAALCTWVAVLAEGRLVATAHPPRALLAAAGPDLDRFSLAARVVSLHEASFVARVPPGALRAACEALERGRLLPGGPVAAWAPSSPSLEDAFVALAAPPRP